MKARHLFLIAVLFVFQSLSAQHVMEISGRIVAQGSDEALPYTNIAAYAPNDSLTTGVLSDDKGRFTLKCDCSDDCYIIISHIGMEPLRIIAKQWQGTRRDLGKISLSPSAIALTTVNVMDTTPVIDRRFDRTVIKIDETRKATAQTIYDILRTLPGLSVDGNGNMKYNGSTPAVYVDDCPSDLLYPMLESIPIDRIEKVELIEASVRQGGEGRGGIVNIRLRAADDGFSGSIATKPTTYNFKELNDSDNSINVNYKRKKFIWITNASLRTTNNSYGYLMQKDFRPTGQNIVYNEEQTASNKYMVSGNSIGFIYQPNDYTQLTVAGSYSYSSSAKTMDRLMQEWHDETNLHSDILALSADYQSSSPNGGIGIDFYRQFKNNSRHYINSSVYIASYHDRFYGDYNENYHYLGGLAVDSIYTERYDNHLSKSPTVYFNTYYNNPIKDNFIWSVSCTLDGIFNRETSTERFSNEVPILLKTQSQHYNSVYSYLSSNFTYFVGNWRLTGGLSFGDKAFKGQFNYYNDETEQFDTQEVNENYLRFIPSATLHYRFNWKNSISLTLANTWEYPYFEDTKSFIDKSINYQWTTGNPDLKPSPNYSAFLNYESFGDTWSIAPSVFFKYQDKLISNIPIQIDPLTRLLYPVNIAERTNNGLDFSTSFRIKKLRVNFYSSVYYAKFRICENQAFEGLDISNAYTERRGVNGYGYCMFSYNIKSVNLSSTIDYWNNEMLFNGTSNDYFTLSINASRFFFNNKLLVNMGVENLLRDLSPNTNHSENFGVITDTELFGYYNQPMYKLSLRYNFRFGSRNTDRVRGMRYF